MDNPISSGVSGTRINDVLNALQNGVTAINNLSNSVTTKISSVVTATPGGSSGQIQFNNTGVFGGFTVGGDATLTSSNGTLTIGSNAVTYGKFQTVGSSKLLGNPTNATANVSEISIGAGLAFSGSTLINTISSAPASGLTFLGTVTTISSQIVDTSTTSNIINANSTTYRSFKLIYKNIVPGTNGITLSLQVHSGGTFQNTSYLNAIWVVQSGGGTGAGGLTTGIELSGANSVANSAPGLAGETTVSNLAGTTDKKHWYGITSHTLSAGGQNTTMLGGYWNGGNGAIDGFQIVASASNITSGNVDVYGML